MKKAVVSTVLTVAAASTTGPPVESSKSPNPSKTKIYSKTPGTPQSDNEGNGHGKERRKKKRQSLKQLADNRASRIPDSPRKERLERRGSLLQRLKNPRRRKGNRGKFEGPTRPLVVPSPTDSIWQLDKVKVLIEAGLQLGSGDALELAGEDKEKYHLLRKGAQFQLVRETDFPKMLLNGWSFAPSGKFVPGLNGFQYSDKDAIYEDPDQYSDEGANPYANDDSDDDNPDGYSAEEESGDEGPCVVPMNRYAADAVYHSSDVGIYEDPDGRHVYQNAGVYGAMCGPGSGI